MNVTAGILRQHLKVGSAFPVLLKRTCTPSRTSKLSSKQNQPYFFINILSSKWMAGTWNGGSGIDPFSER
jgi:hypothetical protein